MRAESSILERVRALIARLAPSSACDECIAEKVNLPWSSQANQAARELAGTDGFVRSTGVCALCGAPRIVTTRKT
jgi:hypothetical protein